MSLSVTPSSGQHGAGSNTIGLDHLQGTLHLCIGKKNNKADMVRQVSQEPPAGKQLISLSS